MGNFDELIGLMTDEEEDVIDPNEVNQPINRPKKVAQPVEPESPGFIGSVKRGVHETKGMLYGAGALAGSGLGIPGLKEWGMKGYEEEMTEAEKHAATTSLKEVITEDPSKAGTWAIETLGSLIPTMAEAAIGAVIGSLVAPGAGTGVGAFAGKTILKKSIQKQIAKQLGKKALSHEARQQLEKEITKHALRKLGAQIGMGAAVLPMEAGGNYAEALKEKGVDNPYSALVTGAAATALEYLGGNMRLIDKFFGGSASKALSRALSEQSPKILKRIAKDMLAMAPAEAAQEAGQELLSALNIVVNTDEKLLTPETGWRLLESAGAGALGGGAGAVVSSVKSSHPNENIKLLKPEDTGEKEGVPGKGIGLSGGLDEAFRKPSTAHGLSSGMDSQQVEFNRKQKQVTAERRRLEKQVVKKRQEAAQNEQLRQVMVAQAQAEAEARRQKEDQLHKQAVERQHFLQQMEDPIKVMNLGSEALFAEEEAGKNIKPVREAHKAIKTGLDNLGKLTTIQYNLDEYIRSGKIGELDWHTRHITTQLKDMVDRQATNLRVQEQMEKLRQAGEEQAKKTKTFAEQVEKTRTQASIEAAKGKRYTKLAPTTLKTGSEIAKKAAEVKAESAARFAEVEEKRVAEAEKREKQAKVKADLTKWKEEKQKKAKEAAKKLHPAQILRYSRGNWKNARQYAREQQKVGQGLSKQEHAEAEKMWEEAEGLWDKPARGKPVDIKPAIQMTDGTILVGDSHLDIINKMTDSQLAEIEGVASKAKRGFLVKGEGFLTPDVTQEKYGVSKSEDLRWHYSKSAKKTGPSESEMGIIRTLDTLQSRAKSPLKIHVVRTLKELTKRGVKSQGENIEAATIRDKDGTPKEIYFVLENLKDAPHAMRTWLHEQVGHYGLIETLRQHGIITKDFMNALHKLLRNTEAYKQISEAYAEDVKGMSMENRRAYLIEETLAQRAESLNPAKRKMIFQRFKDLINKWLKKVFGITTKIQITMKDVDALLEAAKNRVMFGEERAWLEFKFSNKVYKKWAKDIRKKFPKAYHWYENHQAMVRQIFGNDADLFNALLALTSAGAAVRDNTAWAVETYLFLNGKREKPGARFPNEMKRKLDKLLNGEFIHEAMQSPTVKVPEFIRALLGDEKATVNDRWMYRAFFGNSKLTASLIETHREDLSSLDSLFNLAENTAARHKLFELAKELTDETGEKWTPRDLQAAIWMHFASEEKGISPADEWDYEKGLTTPSNKYNGLTPIEYLRKEMGDTPIGQLHQKIKVGKSERVSRLEKMYVQYLKKQGVKQIERYSTMPESIGMGVHYKATELKKGDFILATDREGRVKHNNYSMSDIGNRLAAHTEKNPYAPLVYFYEAGTKPESQLKGKPNVYLLDPKDYKIYDSITDALGLRWETEKRLKRDKGASDTNILANLIKEEGYDGFITNSPYGKGRWILVFEKAAVEHLPVTVDVGIGDVVESVESLPQSVSQLQKMLGKRSTDFYKRITKVKESYPEVTIEGFNPTIAQFKEATSDVLEIGGALRLTGPLPSVKAFVSEVAIEHGQRQVYVMQPKEGSSALMVKFKVKPSLGTVEDVQKALTKHGITDFNIVIKRDTGSIFIEQYLWDEKVVDKFLKMMEDVAHPGFPLNTVYDAESEILGDDNFGLAPEKFKEYLVKYFGEKHGERVYEKAIQRREDYLKRLSGETGQEVRYSRPQGETPEGQDQGILQKIKETGKQPISSAQTHAEVHYKRGLPTGTPEERYEAAKDFFGPTEDDPVNALNMTWKDRLVKDVADNLYALKKLEKQFPNLDASLSGYKSFNMMSNFPAILSAMLHHGRVQFEENWINVKPEEEGGLATVVQRLGKTADDFFYRLTAKSAQEMLNKGRRNLFGTQVKDQDMINAITEGTAEAYKENKQLWDEAEKRLREINTSVLDFLEKAGIVNAEQRQNWERYHYIPFYRVDQDTLADAENIERLFTKPEIAKIHRLEGGKERIGDPMVNLLNAYSHLLNEGLKNLSRKKTLRLAKEVDLISEVTDNKRLEKGVVHIRVNGESQYYKVEDPMLYDALIEVDNITQGFFSKALSFPKKLLTFGVTVAPGFRMANLFRDMIHTSVIAKDFRPIIDTLKGLRHALFNTDVMKEFASTGGSFTGAYHRRDVRADTASEIKKLKRRLSRKKRSLGNPLRWWELWEKVGEASENAARLGLYMQKRKKGASKFEAAYEAKDLLDFHRTGKSKLLGLLIQTIPFLNARIQGLYKLGRTATDEKTYKHFWLRGMIAMAAAMALYGWNKDDDRYKDLPDYEKMTYFHLFDIFADGDHVRLPVPFEIGSLFMVLPPAIWETAEGKRDTSDLGRLTWAMMNDVFRMDMPQFMKPAVQQWANKDMFTGLPIVTEYEQKLEPKYQVSARTSKIAQTIGDVTNISPKRIDQLTKDIFGSMSLFVTDFLDSALVNAEAFPEDPAETFSESWYKSGIGRFYRATGEVPRHIKAEQQYYKVWKEVDSAYNTYRYLLRTGKRFEAKEFVKKNIKKIRMRKPMNAWQKKIRTINTKIKLTLMSRKLNSRQKRAQLDRLLAARHKIFDKIVNTLKGA